MNFWKNGDPNGALLEFQSVEIKELDEVINFRALAEGRMSPESRQKRCSWPELLCLSTKEREKGKMKRERERERDGCALGREREKSDVRGSVLGKSHWVCYGVSHSHTNTSTTPTCFQWAKQSNSNISHGFWPK